jgi:hypothetical protein
MPLPLMAPLLEPVPLLPGLSVMLPGPVLPEPPMVPVPAPVPLLPMSPVVPVRPVLPVVPLPLVEPVPLVEPTLLPEPEPLPPPDPLPCAKTNVAVMQSTARVRMSIFVVDVRCIIVSFESSLVKEMVPMRITFLALQVPSVTARVPAHLAICMPQG